MDVSQLKYAATHEWAALDGDVVTVGITQFAVDQLGDVVFLELPEIGATVEAGVSFADIESVKAVSELFAPVSGEVIDFNDVVVDDPAAIAEDPFGAGWLIKIRTADTSPLDKLLSKAEYDEQCVDEE